jgi:hypothetical protein
MKDVDITNGDNACEIGGAARDRATLGIGTPASAHADRGHRGLAVDILSASSGNGRRKWD